MFSCSKTLLAFAYRCPEVVEITLVKHSFQQKYHNPKYCILFSSMLANMDVLFMLHD